MLNISIELTKEQIENAFENAEIKVSQAKIKKLVKMVSQEDMNAKEALEERFIEFLEEMISDEWER